VVGGRAGELPVDAWLGAVGRELSDQRPELEYSVRLARDRVSASGRVTCWVSQTVNAGLAVERLLTHFGAPADVLASRQGGERWVRQGVGIDATGAEPAYRYYLHSRRPETLAPEYRSWCWVRGGPATARRYSFHFLPETPQGLRPAELVPAELRPPLAELLASEQLRRCSGFWLRTTPTGEIDQLDLALPWQPAASSLPGLADIIALAGSGGDFRWQDLPIRHVALSLGPSPLTVTLYVRGAAGGTWPADEGAMRAQARNGAAQAGRQVRRLMIEHLPASDSVSESAGQPLGSFYDGDVATWRQVLGDRMHYHHGLFHDELAPDLTAALDRAVTELYPFIPAGGRLYDVGC
jgi:hypothetical protein